MKVAIETSPPVLTPGQIAEFNDQGYLALPPLISESEVAHLRTMIARLFERKAGLDQGAYFNFAGAEEDSEAPFIPQIVAPQNFAAELRKSTFRRHATALARQLLGPMARFHIDHTLVKPPHEGAATPWHQDEAFKDPAFEYSEISFWMPLQPVDDRNGCMSFVPASHRRGILPHQTPNDDPRVHAIECTGGFDPEEAVACPLPAGGCTLHTGRTLHAAGPNRSNAPRYAYVLIFHLPPEPARAPRSFPWLAGKKTARMERRDRWLSRGGNYVNFWRTVREKELRDYGRTLRRLRRRLLGF